MLTVVFVWFLVVADKFDVNCMLLYGNGNHAQSKNRVSSQDALTKSRDGLDFCEAGCVLNDPKYPPRIDDPGRSRYDTFSVISSSYVLEILGGPYEGVSEHPLRVMLSEVTLSRSFKTSFELEGLLLKEGELIQRITFNFKTEFEISRSSGGSGTYTVRIPHVVPHVILQFNYLLQQEERELGGAVVVEAHDYPRTLEVGLEVDEDGRCWMSPVDQTVFEDYLISIKVRGENRSAVGPVSTIVQESLIEQGFPFEAYMAQINEFVLKFLKESVRPETSVIKSNKSFNKLCDTISHKIDRPVSDPHSSGSSEENVSSGEADYDSEEEGCDSCEDDSCRRCCETPRCRETKCRRNIKVIVQT